MKNTIKIILLTVFAMLLTTLTLTSCEVLSLFCSHTWSEWEMSDAPTCQSEGEKKRVCSICGDTEYDFIEMLDHEGEWVVTVAPTCEEGGRGHMECKKCHDNWDNSYIAPTGHKESSPITVEPTCGDDGKIYTVCETCGKDITFIEWIFPTYNHTFGDWIIDIDATCESLGERHRDCQVCDYSEIEEIETLGHTYDEYEMCTQCSRTNEKYFVFTPHYSGNYISYYIISPSPDYTLPRNVVIPNTYMGKPVAEMKGFSGRTDLIFLTLGSNITTIGAFEFDGCTSLQSVIFSESLTTIESYAFRDCTKLVSVKIPNSVTKIESFAFYGCINMGEIDVSDNLTYIGEYAFTNTEYYNTSYNWSGRALYLENYLIAAKRDYISGEFSIKEGTVLIGSGTLLQCKMITSITMPDSVLYIGDSAFRECESLTEISLSKNLKSIGHYAFMWCNNLESVDIDASLESLGTGVFYECENLKSVRFGDNCTFDIMFQSVFQGCVKLESVNIPESIDYICDYAFYDCHSLKSIIIPSNVNHIARYCFYNCKSLTEIEIPKYVTVIDEYTFYGCESLRSVKLQDYVGHIEDYAFYGCENLTEITLPYSITSIEPYAFAESGLTEITIPNYIDYIKDYAFYGCQDLSDINIEPLETFDKYRLIRIGKNVFSDTAYYDNESNWVDGILYIQDYLIRGDASMTGKITVKDGVIIAAENAFEDCQFTSVTLPESFMEISNEMFIDCHMLEIVNIPDDVMSIGYAAFKNCGNLKTIVIPDNVKSISDYTFYDCGLESIVIPDSVISIGKYAFYSCSLRSVELGNNVESIGNYAFEKCSLLESIVIPASVMEIGYMAFCCEYDFDFNPLGISCVIFEDPSDWYVGTYEHFKPYDGEGTELSASDLSNTKTAAKYLNYTYTYSYWKKVYTYDE